jgi:predicted TPR repeat methyltransferase
MTADPRTEQARALFLSGNAHAEAGRVDEAAADYEAALALVPGRPSLLGNLGLMRFHQQRWADAADLLAQGPAQDPALSLTRAIALLRLNRLDEALAALDQTLALDDRVAEAWSQRGHLMRETGHLQEAARCYRQALVCGAHEALHRYYLAAVSDVTDPPAPPEVYAQALFDDYADDFQDHLVHTLRYTAHETLLRPLLDACRRFGRVLDLGCGTGLCGRLIAPLADAVDGVDIAPAMVAQARASGFYRQVDQASLLDWLRADHPPADLVVAADVFIYTGPLAPVFDAVVPRLAPGGLLAFSVEQADAGRDLQLRPSLRYAHGRAGVERLAAAHRLAVQALWEAPIRQDQGRPLMGWYVILRREA